MAEALYASVAPHNCDGPPKTMASVHLCANIPNSIIPESFEGYDMLWCAGLLLDALRLRTVIATYPLHTAGHSCGGNGKELPRGRNALVNSGLAANLNTNSNSRSGASSFAGGLVTLMIADIVLSLITLGLYPPL